MTPSRRDAIRLIGAAGGALVVGVHLPGCALGRGPGRIALRAAATGEFRPNAWIRITPDDRVIFTLDRVEMGQGTMTSHTVLIAEELDVDPTAIEVVFAEASRDYDNPEMRLQITGSSTSLRTSWEPLRRAGATAREMLRRAAAERWVVELDGCEARDGAVHHVASNRSARYGELAGAAALQDVPEIDLKEPERFRWIGTSLRRLDAPAKTDGSAIYGIDVRIPGMLSAVVVRCPVRGGTVQRFDRDSAKRLPGVVDVFAIDEGVAIVARTYWEARRAADAADVSWNEGRFAAADSAAMSRAYRALAAQRGAKVRDDGNAYRALRRASRTVEATYEVPYLAHTPMEPMNATARVAAGRCEIWAPTQSPAIARLRAAEALGLDERDVTVHTTLLGGGFGRRIAQDYVVEAVKIAHRTGEAVKVVWSREDDLAGDFYRPMAVSSMRGSLDRTGRVTGWLHRIVTQSIISHTANDFVGAVAPAATPRSLRRWMSRASSRSFARGMPIDTTSTDGAADLPYAIPHLRVESIVAETGVPVGFWRSVGHSHNAFATESFLDELAAAAGRDPLELRVELLADRPRHRAVLELAAAEADWGGALPVGVGRGIAVHASFRSFCAQVIEAAIEGARVRVRRVVCAIDCGRAVNPDLVVAQIESGVIFGLSAALDQQITFASGRVQERNFHQFPLLRIHECPKIEVHVVPSTEPPSGVGEPGVPPVAPALCGAIFAATGRRIRRLPVHAALAEDP